jgi:hypothetical protein
MKLLLEFNSTGEQQSEKKILTGLRNAGKQIILMYCKLQIE